MADGAGQVSMPARLRGAFRGPTAAIAANHPLAAQEGLRILHAGGSAADAAIAAAAVMVVVQPHNSHLGGDLFAMTYKGGTGEVDALNSSGPAPASARLADYQARGTMPWGGPLSVTTPGCVDGWRKLHERFGRLPWPDLFGAAIRYAAAGFPASRSLASAVRGSQKVQPRTYFESIFGHATQAGARVVQTDLARTLEAVASEGAAGFYAGSVAEACLGTLNEGGAAFTTADWHGPGRWEVPVQAAFAGFTLHTQPPPSQGFVLPLAAVVYERLLGKRTGQPAAMLQQEALKTAFTLRTALAGDPGSVDFDAQELLDSATSGTLPNLAPSGRPPRDGDTTYLLAIDSDGNAVSLIQSVYDVWGSGVFVPGTGILLNNRMCGFSLEDRHPNVLAPGKRPMHTLHTYLVTNPGGSLHAVGGTPGAMQQPQTNLQVLDAILRLGMDPQDALDLPRWALGSLSANDHDYGRVLVEAHSPDELTPAFEAAGLTVENVEAWRFGRSYVAVIEDAGIAAAADIRGEGLALVV